MLRYMGQATLNSQSNYSHPHFADKSNDVKAIISICNPFYLDQTARNLQKTHFGVYDKYVASFQYYAFKEKRFKNQASFLSDEDLALAPRWPFNTARDFDNFTRAKIWGYPSSKEFYQDVSCARFLKDIQKPFLVLLAKDDPMILPRDVPVDLIEENENALLINSEYGCHCDFFTKEEGG